MALSIPVLANQGRPVTSKHYEWQVLINSRWLPIDNDFVIEAHYTQPGAKEIRINTEYGCMCIDFDLLQVKNLTSSYPFDIQRIYHLPPGQMEDIGWYFKDNKAWQEYGLPMDGFPSSFSSKDIELLFSKNPQGSMSFMVGSSDYVLDFATMTQTNCTTGKTRNVRRRPKLSANPWRKDLHQTYIPASASAPRWQFLDLDGVWKDYLRDRNQCSVASSDIELNYRQNLPKMTFTTRTFRYELDFKAMTQKNLSSNTVRPIRRLEQ